MAKRRRKRQSIRTVIKNYGLMWDRHKVFWGTGGEGGRVANRFDEFRITKMGGQK